MESDRCPKGLRIELIKDVFRIKLFFVNVLKCLLKNLLQLVEVRLALLVSDQPVSLLSTVHVCELTPLVFAFEQSAL